MIPLINPLSFNLRPQEVKILNFRVSDELNNKIIAIELDQKLLNKHILILTPVTHISDNKLIVVIKNSVDLRFIDRWGTVDLFLKNKELIGNMFILGDLAAKKE